MKSCFLRFSQIVSAGIILTGCATTDSPDLDGMRAIAARGDFNTAAYMAESSARKYKPGDTYWAIGLHNAIVWQNSAGQPSKARALLAECLQTAGAHINLCRLAESRLSRSPEEEQKIARSNVQSSIEVTTELLNKAIAEGKTWEINHYRGELDKLRSQATGLNISAPKVDSAPDTASSNSQALSILLQQQQQSMQQRPQLALPAPPRDSGVRSTPTPSAASNSNRRNPVSNCVSVRTETDYRPKLSNEQYRWVFQNNCSSEVALTYFPKGGRDRIQPDGFSAKSSNLKNLRPGESSSHTVYKQNLPVNLEFVACPAPTTVGPRYDSAGGWYCSAY